jgi:hypothetical protein
MPYALGPCNKCRGDIWERDEAVRHRSAGRLHRWYCLICGWDIHIRVNPNTQEEVSG